MHSTSEPTRATPVVTVITPAYNTASFMAQTLESVLAQTFGSFEMIVVDDGSTDGTGEIADQFAARDSRIRVVHQKNRGISAARNVGLAQARGDSAAPMISASN